MAAVAYLVLHFLVVFSIYSFVSPAIEYLYQLMGLPEWIKIVWKIGWIVIIDRAVSHQVNTLASLLSGKKESK